MNRASRIRLALLWLAVLLVYGTGLTHTPPHLHRDEVVIALQAHSIATTGHDRDGRFLPLYFKMDDLTERNWFQPQIIYVTALFLQVLPFTEWSFRVPTIFVGLLDVLLMYFVARRIFGTDRWALIAAALLAMTPAHFLHSRLAFDFIYPLPFVLTWLLCLLIFLDRQRPALLFAATSALGLGFFSYIASVVMMPVYLAFTALVLMATRNLSVRTGAVALGGFVWPLVALIPWLATQPTFMFDVMNKYGVGARSLAMIGPGVRSFADVVNNLEQRLNFAEMAGRVTLYWSFFDPAFLFLSGGYTRMTNSTRLVGVFLAPFIVLIPLGLIQMVTAHRTIISVVIALGFFLAPLAAVMTVLEPYASDRELAVMVFGVLIATYGIERVVTLWWKPPSTSMWRQPLRVACIAVLAALPAHFLFSQFHYFGDYHGRSASYFEWNHRDALEAIVARQTGATARPVYLSSGLEKQIAAYWRLSLIKNNRLDLLDHTAYFNSQTVDPASIPKGSLIFVTVDDKRLLERVPGGEFREVFQAPEPADPPAFFILEK
ncbi:MAG: ArnT family glycosyltransferase [Vicinamibacterales bacterium]